MQVGEPAAGNGDVVRLEGYMGVYFASLTSHAGSGEGGNFLGQPRPAEKSG
jgi:hypothetical protein